MVKREGINANCVNKVFIVALSFESTQINTDDEYFTSNSVKGHIVDSFVLEDQCRLVPIETIESSCYCIEQHFNDDEDHVAKRFMYFKDIKEWADIFVNKEY